MQRNVDIIPRLLTLMGNSPLKIIPIMVALALSQLLAVPTGSFLL